MERLVEIREGATRIFVSKKVFYNKLAKFSRSIGVPVVSMESRLKNNIVVADALAATGIRGII